MAQTRNLGLAKSLEAHQQELHMPAGEDVGCTEEDSTRDIHTVLYSSVS